MRRLAFVWMLAALPAGATSVMFGLGGDPNQHYSFTPVGAAPGTVDTVDAGPYIGWYGEDVPEDAVSFVSLDYLEISRWTQKYPGTEMPPASEPELEASYLSAQLVRSGGGTAPLAQQGAISMAIWQIMSANSGSVPLDPAAQSYVAAAMAAYRSGMLTATDFPNTLIFDPHDPHVPRFMMLADGNLLLGQVQSDPANSPESGTLVLLIAGLGLVGVSRYLRRRRPG